MLCVVRKNLEQPDGKFDGVNVNSARGNARTRIPRRMGRRERACVRHMLWLASDKRGGTVRFFLEIRRKVARARARYSEFITTFIYCLMNDYRVRAARACAPRVRLTCAQQMFISICM